MPPNTPPDPNKPIQSDVSPVVPVVVDSSELFQKDPEPVTAEAALQAAKPAKRRRLMIISTVTLLLLVSVMGVAAMVRQSVSQQTETGKEEQSAGSQDDNLGNLETELETSQQASEAETPATSPLPSPAPAPSTVPSSPPPTAGTTLTAKTYEIIYTNSCYSPANRTIKKGDTIIFVNNSSRNMWPASDNHPSHTLYSEFDAKNDIAPGGAYSFTFTKTGVWGYHDHSKPNCEGTITVQ
jgi:plastocyanin